MTSEAFAEAAGVSRETLERFEVHLDRLREWQQRKNLVAASTLADPWRRHFLDSAQLRPLIPDDAHTVVDLGSGAGFPGLVLAVLGVPGVHLVESDQTKARFLVETARAIGADVTVHAERAESVGEGKLRGRADVVTSRAVAPLPKLLRYAAPILAPEGIAIFPKGARVDEELTAAAHDWKMAAGRFPSRSDPRGVILRLAHIRRKRR